MIKQPHKTPVNYGKKASSDRVVHKVYKLTLTFQAPLLSQTGGTLGMGIDSMMQRYQNQYALNGSSIKGGVRHALDQFVLLLPDNEQRTLNQLITRWLGYKPPSEDDPTQWRPDQARSKIYFDTFWFYHGSTSTKKTKKLRNRIKINAQDTVEEGALMSVEDCFELDTEPTFSGCLRASFNNDLEQQQFEQTMHKALQLIPAMGSLKGIGFGRLLKAYLKPETSNSTALKLKERTERTYLRLCFAQPFCVISIPPNDNRIQSTDFINGAILKGAMAQQYARSLAEANVDKITISKRLNNKYQFDNLLVSHALPVAKGMSQRPLPIPFSLVSNGDVLFDASGYTLEQLIEELGDKTASFQLDWKNEEWAAASALCQQPPAPKHITLIRTAIDDERKTAKDGQLFSMECVDPVATDWIFHLDLSETDKNKRTGILRDLAMLLEKGIEGIGKTKAHANLEVIQELDTTSSSALPQTFSSPFMVKVLLVTQARLLPCQLERLLKNTPLDQQNDQALEHLYQNYWQNQSDNSLSVVRYFARQKRYGGQYIKHHYQAKIDYAPEWITEAGSIFVLNVENQQGLDRLKHWERVGLPAASNADNIPATWETTAFIPENGYGEICINWDILDQYHSPQTGYLIPKKESK